MASRWWLAGLLFGCGAGSEQARTPATPTPRPVTAEPPAPVVTPPAKAPVDEAPARAEPADPRALRTMCWSVAHIGDSTSTGSMSENYVRDPEARLDRQYARVGVENLVIEHAGGRSMVEHRKQKNGVMVATELRERGFQGCWVIGLGTNDAANATKDPSVPPAKRIERMMAVIGDEPVLWIDVATRVEEGYWASDNMRRWNEELEAALVGRPNARIYRWSEEVQDEWYVRDGIHFSSAGYAARARLVADALARAFPAERPAR